MRGFVAARPQQTFDQLARELGSPIAPVQVEMAFLAECRDAERFMEGAAECLARSIVHQFPKGWRRSVRADFRVASALVNWATSMLHDVDQKVLSKTDLDAIATALTEQVSPPLGWLPSTGQDPLIQEAFGLALERRILDA
jgi:hypothetical protein